LRLFEVRSWNYAGPDTPEFDRAEPAFHARVDRDATGAMGPVEIDAVRPDGSKLQVSRDWAN
jgi:hypothetical protein